MRERRRDLHARIVDAIERRHSDRLSEQVERFAYHAFQAGAWEKAVGYFRQAGLKAMGRSASHEAAGCFDQALIVLAHLPESREARERTVDLRMELQSA